MTQRSAMCPRCTLAPQAACPGRGTRPGTGSHQQTASLHTRVNCTGTLISVLVITSYLGHVLGHSCLFAHSNSAVPKTWKGQQGLQKIPVSYLQQFPQVIKLFNHACFKVHEIKKQKKPKKNPTQRNTKAGQSVEAGLFHQLSSTCQAILWPQ